jgi:hypothetical protein
MKSLTYLFSIPNGYQMIGGYLTGTGTGMDFYPLHLTDTGIIEIGRYVNGKVNALLAPYPTRCHP